MSNLCIKNLISAATASEMFTIESVDQDSIIVVKKKIVDNKKTAEIPLQIQRG